ncbi:MAG: arginyltransferase [Acidobacteriota bacterium]
MFELTQDDPCPYLPGLEARTRYRVIERCSVAEYERLLERGWRRFGCTFFRPVCSVCQECRSLRLEIATFGPNRSQRRTWKKNRDLRVVCQPASLTPEHLDLYERYHRDMEGRRGWQERSLGPMQYAQTFVEGRHGWGHELLFFDRDRLLCVALIDLLPRAISAVYCYYDPEERQRGLGVYSVLYQAALARQRDLAHLYLGFWIQGNPSMRYKAGYRPHELLIGRPEADQDPVWAPPEASTELG